MSVVAAVTVFLATGSSSSRHQSRLGDPPAASIACNQPLPSAGADQVTLSGVGYGPYHAGQDPNYGISPSSAEVAADAPTLSAFTNYIRIYSSTGPADEILKVAEAAHICVSLGIWLGRNAEANASEITAGVRLAKQSPAVRSVIVGNEVLIRGDLSVSQLIQDIRKVRAALGHTVAISTADDFHQWLAHPELAQAVDFVTIHIYPFWQNVPIGSAIRRLSHDYGLVTRRFPGRPIVIGETGWPSATDTFSTAAAVPNPQNQAVYFHEFVTWAQQHRVPYFYFDAFDEDWKTNEHGVGTHWGLYDLSGNPKPTLAHWLPAANPQTVKERSYRDVFVGSKLEKPFDLGIDTNQHQRHWLTAQPGVLTMAYPAGQQWGAMFITVGPPKNPPRPSQDFSAYDALLVEMKGESGGEQLDIGLKTSAQPDDGSETKLPLTLTSQWHTYTFPLKEFTGTDVRQLYVVTEFVFSGGNAETAYLRNVRFSKGTAKLTSPSPTAQLAVPSPQSACNGILNGHIGYSTHWGSSWLDLDEPANFRKGERLKITLKPSGARQVLVRLLPSGISPDEPVGIIGNRSVTVDNNVVIVQLDKDHSDIKQVSVHGGEQAWDFSLVAGNGPAVIVSVELIC